MTESATIQRPNAGSTFAKPPVILDTQHQLDSITADKVVYPDPVPPTRVLMLDIETLALGARPVITQIALLGYDLEEDTLLDSRHVQYYPVDPQLQLIPPRQIMASTIAWWMTQPDEARERFEFSTSQDFQDLPALARSLIMAFNELTQNGTIEYELVAQHPQFDVVAVETLLEELGFEKPWRHDRVYDLATKLKDAGINRKNVPTPKGFIPHVAFWDARWQIQQYLAAKQAIASR